MKVEKIGDVETLIADEGKCFKNENVKTVVSYITLSKFDSKDNYEEVNIADYELELQREQAQELLGENATNQEIEGSILENDMIRENTNRPVMSAEDIERQRLQNIINNAITEALNR